MKIMKSYKKISTLALALVTTLGLALGSLRAYADANPRTSIYVTKGTSHAAESAGETDASIQLKKTVNKSLGIAFKDETFNFNFNKISADTLTDAATKSTMPDLQVNSNTDLRFSNTELGPAVSTYNKNADIKKGNNNLTGADFPHAGVYVYEVSETPGTTNGMTYDPSKQYVVYYVANKAAGGLYIKTINVIKGSIDTNTGVITGEKVDKLEFVNTLTSNNGQVKIEKNLFDTNKDEQNGSNQNHDNKAKDFIFTIQFTNDSNPTEKIGVDATTSTATKKAVFATIDTQFGTELSKLDYGTEYKFKLKAGEKLIFNNIAIGTTYTVKEEANPNYKPTLTAKEGNVDVTYGTATKKEGTIGNELDSNNNNNNKLMVKQANDGTGDKNEVIFTNEYEFLVVTGILMNNLPFVLMILTATAGIGVYVVAKRRRYSH